MAQFHAKRRVPMVEPVSVNGVRFEPLRGARAQGFQQNGGIIVAIDEATDEPLWNLLVYTNTYQDGLETDVQDVFISELTLSADGKTLTVRNERKKHFSVNLLDRSVTALD